MARGFAEELARAYYRLKGYVVESDIRLERPGHRQPSDIDILAFSDAKVVIVQCKASATQNKADTFVNDTTKWFADAERYLARDHARPLLAAKYKPKQVRKVLVVTQLHSVQGKKYAAVVAGLDREGISVLHAVTMLREMRENILRLTRNGRNSFCEWEWGTLVAALSLLMDIEYEHHRKHHEGNYEGCKACLLKTLLGSVSEMVRGISEIRD